MNSEDFQERSESNPSCRRMDNLHGIARNRHLFYLKVSRRVFSCSTALLATLLDCISSYPDMYQRKIGARDFLPYSNARLHNPLATTVAPDTKKLSLVATSLWCMLWHRLSPPVKGSPKPSLRLFVNVVLPQLPTVRCLDLKH